MWSGTATAVLVLFGCAGFALDVQDCPVVNPGGNVIVNGVESEPVVEQSGYLAHLPTETSTLIYGSEATSCAFDGVITVAGPLSLNPGDKYASYSQTMLQSSIMFLDFLNHVRGGVRVAGKRYGMRAVWVSDSSSVAQVANATAHAIRVYDADFVMAGYSSELGVYTSQQAYENGRLTIAAGASHSSVFSQNNLTFGTLPMQLPGVADSSDAALLGILHAATLIDTGAVEANERCPPPNCRSTLRASFIRTKRTPTFCDEAEKLWVEGGIDVALTSSGSWLKHEIAHGMTESNVRDILAVHQAAGSNILVTCTYESDARKLIAGMEAMNYSLFAFVATVAINEAFIQDVQFRGWWQGNYVIGTSAWDPKVPARGDFSGITSTEFSEAYLARWHSTVDYRGASQFAAYCVLAAAIESAGSLNATAVAEHLQHIHLHEFYSNLSFNEYRQNADGSIALQLQPILEVVAPLSAASAPMIFPMPTWALRRCQVHSQEATGNECSGHGLCSDAGECVCNHLWDGVYCHESIEDETLYLVLGLGGAACFIFLVGAAIVVKKCMRRYNLAIKAERKALELKRERICVAKDAVSRCSFSMCYVSFPAFKSYGRLVSHEEARKRGDLIYLDTFAQIQAFAQSHSTVFFSHQWLSYGDPDPKCVHYLAMVDAIERLCYECGVDEDDFYLWVDYTSIPQVNQKLQQLSISSLALYASSVTYFIIIAPPAIHESTQLECNPETYQRRGWCRLEQWSRLTVGGLDNMFLFDGEELASIDDAQHWFEDSINVLGGDFSQPSDRGRLVDTVLGLWAVAINNHMNPNLGIEEKAQANKIVEIVNRNRDRVFPQEFFGDLVVVMEADLGFVSVPDSEFKSLTGRPLWTVSPNDVRVSRHSLDQHSLVLRNIFEVAKGQDKARGGKLRLRKQTPNEKPTRPGVLLRSLSNGEALLKAWQAGRPGTPKPLEKGASKPRAFARTLSNGEGLSNANSKPRGLWRALSSGEGLAKALNTCSSQYPGTSGKAQTRSEPIVRGVSQPKSKWSSDGSDSNTCTSQYPGRSGKVQTRSEPIVRDVSQPKSKSSSDGSESKTSCSKARVLFRTLSNGGAQIKGAQADASREDDPVARPVLQRLGSSKTRNAPALARAKSVGFGGMKV